MGMLKASYWKLNGPVWSRSEEEKRERMMKFLVPLDPKGLRRLGKKKYIYILKDRNQQIFSFFPFERFLELLKILFETRDTIFLIL